MSASPSTACDAAALDETDAAFDHPAMETVQLSEVLRALGDRERLAIVQRLLNCSVGLNCRESASAKVPKSTLSRHYATLRAAGVIWTRRDEGGRQLSRVRREELDARFPGLMDAVLADGGTANPAADH